MRIIHTSDLHLDSPLTSRLSPMKSRERKRELIDSFRRTVDEAIRLGAEAYVIAGDLFDSERGSPSVMERVLEIIAKTPSVTFLYLPGNHEKDRLTSAGIPLPENLKLFGDGWTCFSKGKVNFIGRAKTEKNMFDSLKLDKNETNILVLHGELKDSSDKDGVIGRSELVDKGIDYIALGHYHTYSYTNIDTRCTAVYSGTPEGRGFDETGEKGIVLIDLTGTCVSHTFIPTQKRRLRIVELDASNVHSTLALCDAIRAKTADISSLDMVRVVIKGTVKPGVKHDTDTVLEHFLDAFYHFEIKDESRLEISMDDYINDKSLKGEFIRLVLSRDELSDEEKDSIIDCGLKALMGEE